METKITAADNTIFTFEIPEFKVNNKNIKLSLGTASTDIDLKEKVLLGYIYGKLTFDGINYKFKLELNINSHKINSVHIDPCCPIRDEFKEFVERISYKVD